MMWRTGALGVAAWWVAQGATAVTIPGDPAPWEWEAILDGHTWDIYNPGVNACNPDWDYFTGKIRIHADRADLLAGCFAAPGNYEEAGVLSELTESSTP